MKNIIQLDGIDNVIIKHLQKNPRITNDNIAKSIGGLTKEEVKDRLKKLENKQFIDRYETILNPKMIGYDTIAFLGVIIETGYSYKNVITQLKHIPEIVESYFMSGNYPILIKVLAKNNTDLVDIISKDIKSIQGVSHIETSICLEQQINRAIEFNMV